MKNAEAVLCVKFKSTLSYEALMNVCMEDQGDFRNVAGLLQKYYLTEEMTGAISGIYIFESKDDRAAFWASELARTIPVRYGVIPETLRIEHYEMAIVLNDVLIA